MNKPVRSEFFCLVLVNLLMKGLVKRTQSHPDREVQLSNVLYSVVEYLYDRADLLIVRVSQTFPQSLDYNCMERDLGGININSGQVFFYHLQWAT